jgi:hypothetical protein
MDSFEKATKEREQKLNVFNETNPTNKLYSAKAGKPVDFSQPDPMAGNPEIPGAQAQIDKGKAGRQAARSAAEQASGAATKAWYGNEDSYKSTPDSLFAKYGVASELYKLLEAEKKGLVTVNPQFRKDIEEAVAADQREKAAWETKTAKDRAEGVQAFDGATGAEQPYRIVDGRRVYR